MNKVLIVFTAIIFNLNCIAQTKVFIPDVNFRNYLQAYYPNTISGDSVLIDSAQTVQDTMYIDFNYRNLSNFSGLEYFTNLRGLKMNNNDSLTNIPSLAANTQLLYLDLFSLNMDSILDLSGNTALQTIVLEYNSALTSLPDLSFNINLKHLESRSNSLAFAPDLSSNTSLEYLKLYGGNLTSLPDLTNNVLLSYLNCQYNNLISLPDLTYNIALTSIDCYNNNLTSLPDLLTNIALEYLNCTGNPISLLPDLSNNTALRTLYFGDANLIASPDLSFNTALESITCSQTNLNFFSDLSNNIVLKELRLHYNELTELPDLTNNTALQLVYFHDNNLSSIPDMSGKSALKTVYFNLNRLDFSDARELLIVDNMAGVTTYNYSGQKPFGYIDSLLFCTGNNAVISIQSQDSATSYQWYKDGVLIGGETDSMMVLSNIQPSDSGTYACQSLGTALISMGISSFVSEDIIVKVVDSSSACNTVTGDALITGKVYYDSIPNCAIDSTESGLNKWLVRLTPGPIYVQTDEQGVYTALVDTGTYTIKVIPKNEFFAATCTTSYSLNIANATDSSFQNDFGITKLIDCPLLSVDIATGRVRRCMNNNFTVFYDNHGTTISDSTYIIVAFDDSLTPLSSTLPWAFNNGNEYIFNVGKIASNERGVFYVTTKTSCNAAVGSAICVQASIYPNNYSCTPPDSGWDKSSIMVVGGCLQDSLVKFVITNTGDPGEGDMDGESEYRIYVNNQLTLTQKFQIGGGDSLVLIFPGMGNTIRLEADQRAGHPGNSLPRETIEACGTDSVGNMNLGFLTNVQEDDLDIFVETFCVEITGSFDPNDKNVKPGGMTGNNYISSDDELEYLIRFQNTGNDTAFTVVLLDTLSDYLDITTLESGASSHPYSFQIYGQGNFEWTFDNILLPDSNTNEPASHGFVKFKVKQNSNNANDTIISNRASIYFDFNAPVVTNYATVTVFDTVIINNNAMACDLPAASFTHDLTNLVAAFTATTSNVDNYNWDFGDGDTSTQVNPLHTYADSGTYNICLSASNSCGIIKSCKSIDVSICNLPIAAFTTLITDSTLTLLDSSSNIGSYYWDFGDGDSSMLAAPTHAYSDTGIFTVCLYVSNNCGSDSSCQEIYVSSIIGINNQLKDQFEFNIFPNPNTGKFQIEFSSKYLQDVKLEILDVKGSIIFSKEYTGNLRSVQKSINLEYFSKGIFTLRLSTKSGTYSRQIVYE